MTKRGACAEQVQNSKNQHISTAAVRANNQRGIASFAVSADQQQAAVRSLVKDIVTANIPFTFIENRHLVGTCAFQPSTPLTHNIPANP